MSINLEGKYSMKIIFLIILVISFSSCLKSEMNPEDQSSIKHNDNQKVKELSFPSVVDLRNQIIVDTSNIEYGKLKLVDSKTKKTLFQGNIQLLKKDNKIPIQGSVPSEVIVTLDKDNSKQVKVVRLNGKNLTI
jgi:hypothetical protein